MSLASLSDVSFAVFGCRSRLSSTPSSLADRSARAGRTQHASGLARSSRLGFARLCSGLCVVLAMSAAIPDVRAQGVFGLERSQDFVAARQKGKGAAVRIYAVTEGNTLMGLDITSKVDRRSRVKRTFRIAGSAQISGLAQDESIVGIDFRPATGELYGVGNTNRLYVINTQSGAATARGSVFTTPLSGTKFSVDFNPLRDRLRVQSDLGQNLRIDPTSGAVIADAALAFAAGDINANRTPQIAESAYLNSFPGTPSTTLYAIDSSTDSLVIQNPPNDGTLQTVGSLGVDVTTMAAFDIAPGDNTGYAALSPVGSGRSQLYTIDLSTGDATPIYNFNRRKGLVRGLAVEPSAPTNPLPGTPEPTPVPAPVLPPTDTPPVTTPPVTTPPVVTPPIVTPPTFPIDPGFPPFFSPFEPPPVPIGPSRIVFVSTRSGNQEIYSADQNGANVVRLTNNAASDREPYLSRNGRVIAFMSNRGASDADIASNKPEAFEVYVMNVNGTGIVRLTDNATAERAPALNDTGSRVVFVSNRVPTTPVPSAPITIPAPGATPPAAVPANDDIYIINADGTGENRLTSDPALDGDPSFSPDGLKIVFIGARGNGFGIFEMRTSGSGIRQLGFSNALNIQPVYSPDGGRITFASARDGGALEIYTSNADGTNPTRLTFNTIVDQHPTWSPEGSRIAYESASGTAPPPPPVPPAGTPAIPPQVALNVFVMSSNGTNRRQFLATDGTNSFQPSWGKLATGTTPPTTPPGTIPPETPIGTPPSPTNPPTTTPTNPPTTTPTNPPTTTPTNPPTTTPTNPPTTTPTNPPTTTPPTTTPTNPPTTPPATTQAQSRIR